MTLKQRIRRVRNRVRKVAKRRKDIEHTEKLLRKRLEFLRKKKDKKPPSGVVTFDGHPCAAWIAVWLEKSRKAGWKGYLVSGYRDPAYSESLCQAMCGAPSCPGTCAGRASNHAGKDYPAGACDVSDYLNFEAIQRRIGSPLRNDLPRDRVHFSVNGH